MDRVRNSMIQQKVPDRHVFNPTEEELEEIVPEGNKVRIARSKQKYIIL